MVEWTLFSRLMAILWNSDGISDFAQLGVMNRVSSLQPPTTTYTFQIWAHSENPYLISCAEFVPVQAIGDRCVGTTTFAMTA